MAEDTEEEEEETGKKDEVMHLLYMTRQFEQMCWGNYKRSYC